MVIIEFIPEPNEISSARQHDLSQDESVDVEWHCFIMPVRLNVDGVEIFEGIDRDDTNRDGENVYYDLPLLNIAFSGLDWLLSAAAAGSAAYPLPEGGVIYFDVDGDRVSVQCDVNGASAQTTYAELRSAWVDFAERVKLYLIEQAPGLLDHPVWGKRLREPPHT